MSGTRSEWMLRLLDVGRIGNPSVAARNVERDVVDRHHESCGVAPGDGPGFASAFQGRIGNPSYSFLCN